jgi:flavin-dependent dehydrogenase
LGRDYNSDVLIAGGGLAGLSLALQLRKEQPELDIVLLEQKRHPVPVAAHKVGESTVEIGAHYFADKVGLRDHLERDQLPKFGLRYFFGGDNKPTDLAQYDELGPSEFLPVGTFQLDRGILENHMLAEARKAGIAVHDATSVRRISLAEAGSRHRVTARNDDRELTVNTRWLVDSTGRQAKLKKHLNLAKAADHAACAVWLRTAGKIDIDQLGSGTEWHERCGSNERWYSTNHIMGTGYWFWVIPLASGSTSIGLVFDPDIHAVNEVNKMDRLMTWLEQHEPVMAAALEPERNDILDFHVLRHFAHSATQVFSADRWALTGEAGLFLDPFYSPGSDFIAISNTLTANLIGEHAPRRKAAVFQHLYTSIFESTLPLYQKQYPGFGDRDLMTLKTVWDYSYYWGVLAYLFYQHQITNIDFLSAAQPQITKARALNEVIQQQFSDFGALRRQLPSEGRFIDHHAISRLPTLKQQLIDDAAGKEHAQLIANVEMLEILGKNLETQLQACANGATLGDIQDIHGP